MDYQKEINFLRAIFKNYRLQSLVFPLDNIDTTLIDMELRKTLGQEKDYEDITNFINTLKEHQIYRLRDSYMCSYFFLLIDNNNVSSLLTIGPFLEKELNHADIMSIAQEHALSLHVYSTFEEYYSNLPYIRKDSLFLASIHTLAENMWGFSDNYFSDAYLQNISDSYNSTSPLQHSTEYEDTLFNMQILERRYSMENDLLQAVSQGLINKIELLTSRISSFVIEQRTDDSLRNIKNYSITLNTLLRKAAENGSVHPYYIDKLSSQFARKIENANSVEVCDKLQMEMIRKYCLLVRNHSMKGFSPLIQRVIARIDFDLTSDLSLKSLAALFSVNPCYLSSQFKKETNSTLTDYVNRKRIEHAIMLLNSTSMQIQTIATHCGIPDLNYFTKVFKKYIQMTPKEYRTKITNR